MHWQFFCRWQQRVDACVASLDGRHRRARRLELLRDSPAHVAVDGNLADCRDARHLAVPLARTPAWAGGVLALPVARRQRPPTDGAAAGGGVALPPELWRQVVDALDGDLDDLLALRSTSKFFARMVDDRAAALFGPRVRRQVVAHRLVALPARCARAMFATTTSLRWELTDRSDARELTRLLSCMPRLEALELFAPRGPAHEVVLPAGLRALTVVGLRPRRADAWLSALPRGLGHLTLCDAELALGRAPAWPPGLRSLSLQDCTWGHATTLDLQGLTALALVELVAPDAALKMLAVRLPDDGDAPPVGAAYEADPPQRVGRNPWDVARAPRSLRITKRGR